MDSPISTIMALSTPVVQVFLMGLIGYSWARRKPERMIVFRRSGFYWWGAALTVNIVVAFVIAPHSIPMGSLAGNDWTATRFILSILIGLSVLIAIEFGYEIFSIRLSGQAIPPSRAKYEAALPPALRNPSRETVALAAVGALEEVVYRGLALGGLLFWAGLSEPVSCGIASVAFGLGHLYFGPSQLFLKSAEGAVFCSVALSAGWPAALIAHVVLNVILVTIGNRARSAL